MANLIAEIVSVGTELLLGSTVDTHAATMGEILAECGIGCQRRQTVGDNLDRAVQSVKDALARSDIVITIGGLGPTQDDLTRAAIAGALQDRLVRDEAMGARLKARAERLGFRWVESNLNQADRPESATFIENPNGSAPGLLCEKDGKTVIALPGPRGEFNPMAKGAVKDYLSRRAGGTIIHSRTLRVCGEGESSVEKAIKHLMQGDNPSVAPYAKVGEVHLRLTARAASVDAAEAVIAPMESEIRSILGNAVYGVDETTLEEAVIYLLKERRETLAVAESVSGGWLGKRLTSVPGSSECFIGGVIAYAAMVKVAQLGVSDETLAEHGPVSEAVALEMARGVRERLGATYGVSLTGNAGPGVDAGGQPVGLCFVGVAGPGGSFARRSNHPGIREDVRLRATQAALVALRSALLER